MRSFRFTKIKSAIISAVLFFAVATAAFAVVSGVTLTNVPDASLNPGSVNNLVMRIGINDNGTGDSLTYIEVNNTGTADEPADITAVKLWYQPGGGVFDPGTAVYAATLPRIGLRTWALTLSQAVSSGSELYVTADISASPTNLSTIIMQVGKKKMTFSGGAQVPTAAKTNGGTQTITNIAKLYVSRAVTMPSTVNAGQQGVTAMQLGFRNSSPSTDMTVTGLNLTVFNYAGQQNANGTLTQVVIKDGTTTYGSVATMPASPSVSVPLTTGLVVPFGGAVKNVDVLISVSPTINTYDIAVALSRTVDVTTLAGNTVEAYSGYVFPLESSRAVIKSPVNSVNASATGLMPVSVTAGQANIKTMLLTFTHPSSVTTVSDCVISGITVTAATTPSKGMSFLFSKLAVTDGVTAFGSVSVFQNQATVWLPFSAPLTVAPGSSRSVTLTADLLSSITVTGLNLSVAASANIWARDGSDWHQLTVAGTFPAASGTAAVQTAPTGLNVTHINRMPATAVRGQQFVYAQDLVFAHPDAAGAAAVTVRGVTFTVENELGGGIVPSSVLSKITILDALNNTVVSYASIPVTGTKVYIDFTQPVTVQPSSSAQLKVYINIPVATSEPYVKLNLNTGSAVNASDANSGAVVAVSAGAGDAFPMKTSAAFIIDPASSIRMGASDRMPASVNMGQQGVVPFTLYFLNDQNGLASVHGISFDLRDAGGTAVPAASAIGSVRVDNTSNTSVSYAAAAVTTAASSVFIPFTQPVMLYPGVLNAVTATVSVSVADPAAAGTFRMAVISGLSVEARDYSTGSYVTVYAASAPFPLSSSAAAIERRALTLNAAHNPVNAGSAEKGAANLKVMDLIFENPGAAGTSSVVITGITLTAENASGATINASAAISGARVCDASNTSLAYGSVTSMPASELIYISFAQPVIVGPSRVTVSVMADVASSASLPNFRLNMKYPSDIAAFDRNEMLSVTVNAMAPSSFPDMRSDAVTIISSDKLTVSHTDTMPATVSGGQASVKPLELRFSNTTNDPVALRGLTLTVKDNLGLPLQPDSCITAVTLVDGAGNTRLTAAPAPSAGGYVYLTFTSPMQIQPSAYGTVSVYVDIKNNPYTSSFYVSVTGPAMVDASPSTIVVQAEAGHVFPMDSSVTDVQLPALTGGIAHTDVIPTTVSTGQTNIFAEVLTVQNTNTAGSADILMTGITITVQDDTNSVIDPTTAIKRIMVRDDSSVYGFYAAIPSAPGSFYMPFTTPVRLTPAEVKDLKLYVDIVDTLQAGSFQINLVINNDIQFRDSNTQLTVTAQAINGDSFPMKTSTVIIQEKALSCRAAVDGTLPAFANKGQENIRAMSLTFSNTGGTSSANVIISRLTAYTSAVSGTGIPPKSVLSRIQIKDAQGTVYGDVQLVPDFGESVSIGLTTPITVAPGQLKQVFLYCNINPDASEPGFELAVKTGSNIISRDANSYDIINTVAWDGYTFPAVTAYCTIQERSQSLSVSMADLMPASANKGQAIPVMTLNFTNSNPPGYSTVTLEGVTVTVENMAAAAIAADSVVSSLWLADGAGVTLSAAASITASPSVYLRFASPVTLTAGASAAMTLNAGVKALSSELYLRLDLNSQSDIRTLDSNSGTLLSSVAAPFPLRSGYAVILNTPGIAVSATGLTPAEATGGQACVPVMKLKFDNTGSYTEDVTGLTFGLAGAAAQDVLATIRLVDTAGNTYSASVSWAGGDAVLDLTSNPVAPGPQDFTEAVLYADMADVTFNALFSMGLAAATSVAAAVPVSGTFPLNSGTVALKQRPQALYLSHTDLMPPTVSSGQQGVYAMVLTAYNPAPPGSAAVLLTGVTLTVLDSALNTISASRVMSSCRATDFSVVFAESAVGAGERVYVAMTQPVTIAAGASADIYIAADITGNTTDIAGDFMFAIDGGAAVSASDRNAGIAVPVQAQGDSFPMRTSAAYIQKAAQSLKINHVSSMPALVSTGQAAVRAMDLVLNDVGDTRTASVMVTRVNLYLQDASDALINTPSAVIEKMELTNADGNVTYGEVSSFNGAKITLNLTAPLIISSASSVTAAVRIKAASAIGAVPAFKVVLAASPDIYAVDANSFNMVPVTAKSPDIFPMKSQAASLQQQLSSVDIQRTAVLLPFAVTKGGARVPVMAFTVHNPLPAGGANAVFSRLRVSVQDTAGLEISAASAVSTLYAVDAAGATLGSAAAGVPGTVEIAFPAAVTIAPSAYLSVTLYADIHPLAAADDFKLLITGQDSMNVADSNSGYQAFKSASPLLAWEAGPASVFDAPATELIVRHDGSMAPALAGRGLPNVRMTAVSFYNPGSTGTSDVIITGLTMTAVDAYGNTAAPASLFKSLKFTDYSGQETYGYVTLTAAAAQQPFYAAMYAGFPVEASATRTVYAAVDIAQAASTGQFMLRLGGPECVAAHNNPSGAIAVSAGAGDAFPMDSGMTEITAVTYMLKVGHDDLMPVSVAKGAAGIDAMGLKFTNPNSIPVTLAGVTLTVKDRDGNGVEASAFISSIGLYDGSAAVVTAAAGSLSTVLLPVPGFAIAANSSVELTVRLDVAAAAGGSFYVELAAPSDVETLPLANVQADTGEYFGNLRSSAASVQEANLESSFHNFPNPFSPDTGLTRIEYFLQGTAEVTITVFTLDGRTVRKVCERAQKAPGLHFEDTWDGTNGAGTKVRSGVYICVLDVDSDAPGESGKLVRKVLVVK